MKNSLTKTKTMSEHFNEVESVSQLAIASTEIKRVAPEGVPFVLVPDGTTVEELEHLLERPMKLERAQTCFDVASFVRYIEVFKTPSTIIFANLCNGAAFEAILDYHGLVAGKPVPSWCTHRAAYSAEQSVEWARWWQHNKQWLSQADFADHIENNQTDIRVKEGAAYPSGAEMLEIATSLRSKTNVDFASGLRLANGNVQLVYEENSEAKAGQKGELKVPEKFLLGLAVFRNDTVYAVEVRLRFQIREKKLSFRYELVNPHLVVEDAGRGLLKQIQAGTKIEPFLGAA